MMHNSRIFDANKVSSKSKKLGFKRLLDEVIYTIGPGLLLLFLILGSVFEWHYWKKMLWVLFY